MSLGEFEFAAVRIFNPSTTLPKPNLAPHTHQVFHGDDREVYRRVLKAEFEIPLLWVAVYNVTFSKVWNLVTGRGHVFEASR